MSGTIDTCSCDFGYPESCEEHNRLTPEPPQPATLRTVDQTTFGYPDGNCFAASVATILGLSIADVPHYVGDDWYERWTAWLRPRGLYPLTFKLGGWTPPDGALCILAGKSPRGDFNHAVVGSGGRIVHDPHPSRAGLTSIDEVTMLVPYVPTTPAAFWKAVSPAQALALLKAAPKVAGEWRRATDGSERRVDINNNELAWAGRFDDEDVARWMATPREPAFAFKSPDGTAATLAEAKAAADAALGDAGWLLVDDTNERSKP